MTSTRAGAGFAYPTLLVRFYQRDAVHGFHLLFAWQMDAWRSIRLAHIGVDVIASTRKVGQSTAWDLFAAWLLRWLAVALFFAIRLDVERMRTETGRPPRIHEDRHVQHVRFQGH